MVQDHKPDPINRTVAILGFCVSLIALGLSYWSTEQEKDSNLELMAITILYEEMTSQHQLFVTKSIEMKTAFNNKEEQEYIEGICGSVSGIEQCVSCYEILQNLYFIPDDLSSEEKNVNCEGVDRYNSQRLMKFALQHVDSYIPRLQEEIKKTRKQLVTLLN